MLSVESVHLGLGGRAVLAGCSLDVAPGEVVAVIGPNGAGKSSLMSLLSGARRPDRGRVAIDSRQIESLNGRALARARAVLEQAPDLAFPFRCLDLVLLGRDPHIGRSTPARDLAIAEAAMAETDCLAFADRLYPTLSGGERQRVQLARALAQIWPEPEGARAHARDGGRFLLLDEPSNNLDLAHQQALMTTIRRMADAGIGVLAILHDPNLAALGADRLCALKDGRIVADGPTERVLTSDLVGEVFGVHATILRHPRTGRPCILPDGPESCRMAADEITVLSPSHGKRRKQPCSSL